MITQQPQPPITSNLTTIKSHGTANACTYAVSVVRFSAPAPPFRGPADISRRSLSEVISFSAKINRRADNWRRECEIDRRAQFLRIAVRPDPCVIICQRLSAAGLRPESTTLPALSPGYFQSHRPGTVQVTEWHAFYRTNRLLMFRLIDDHQQHNPLLLLYCSSCFSC